MTFCLSTSGSSFIIQCALVQIFFCPLYCVASRCLNSFSDGHDASARAFSSRCFLLVQLTVKFPAACLQFQYVWMLSQELASHKSKIVSFRGHGFQQHFAGSGAPRARKRGAKMDPQIGAL